MAPPVVDAPLSALASLAHLAHDADEVHRLASAARALSPGAVSRVLRVASPRGAVDAGLFAAVWIADWASYAAPSDRVTRDRLASAFARAPSAFTAYVGEAAGEAAGAASPVPVGYAAAFAMSAAEYDALTAAPERWASRAVEARGEVAEGEPAYLFNYGVTPPLVGTSVARTLVLDLAARLHRAKPSALLAITVSHDGARVARRFGLTLRGSLATSPPEEVYAGRFALPDGRASSG
jgi:hypothetical protein